MKEVDGLLTAKNPKPPNPKPSPKDFVWPPQEHDDKVARKIAASLQELLPARGWKHTDLARALWGTDARTGGPRNVGAARRWVVAEHPIPNEQAAGYLAEVLGVPMARLLEPEGNFKAVPEMIRPRSDSKRFPVTDAPKKAKGKKTMSGRDREKQRAYNAAYRARMKAKHGVTKRKYVRRAVINGAAPLAAVNGDPNVWVLQDGIPAPEYQFTSHEDYPGHLKITVEAVVPHARAMAILHMLEHQPQAEE